MGADELSWLADLESRVKAARRTIAALRKENRSLKAKLGRQRSGGDGGEDAAWREEREEIKRRVARLVERLESLLAE